MTVSEKRAAYLAEYYRRNKETRRDHYRRARSLYQAKVRMAVLDLKRKPCADCGGIFPPQIMDFDHLPAYTKRGDISGPSFRRSSLPAVLREIAKCELVCPNCHRIRTLKRRGIL